MVRQPVTSIIIVAAGTGNRFGSNLPKQYHLLEDRPVLMHTIDALRPFGQPVLVLSGNMTGYWAGLCSQYGYESPRVVAGGTTRFESVANALRTIPVAPGDKILVHDGARPLVDAATVKRVIEALDHCPAVIPAVAVTDSLRITGADGRSEAVDRTIYRAVQTPQGFDAVTLVRAYGLPYSPLFTDDASVVEACGVEVTMVEGSPNNIKITTPGDIAVARALMSAK